MNVELPFGPGAKMFIAGYILSLLLLGWLGYRARKGNTLRDFYLGDRSLGVLVLLFTLFATQYSGNTLMGYTGKTYRVGYVWIMCVHFMTAMIVFYLLYAPQLQVRAQRRGYITPTDFLQDRYASAPINVLATLLMVVALSNYLLAQLMAIGRALEGLAGTDPQRAYVFGVVVLALIMVIYETLGGLRAVAWTDVLQGVVMLSGFVLLVILAFQALGGLPTAMEKILQAGEADRTKVMPPTMGWCREWLSYVLIMGMGGALYPQAIQRIYAARSIATLRRSLSVMAFLPLTLTVLAVVIGIMALAHFPGLEGPSTDGVLMLVCREVLQHSMLGYWVVVLLFASVLAAIMSTADSALLSISSMMTKDIYARFLNQKASEETLTRLGKVLSWVLVAIVVALAITLRKNTNLMDLLDRKFDLLVQLVPAFFVGIHWPRLRAGPTFWGMLIGVCISVGLAAFDYGKLFNIHAGLWGLAVNFLIAVGGSRLSGKKNMQ